MQIYYWNDDNGNPQAAYGEAGIPLDYVRRGANTVAGYQMMAQQDLSDKQIAAQQKVADQQNTFNEQQFQSQQDLQQKQQAQADEQAARQTQYDTGRQQALTDAQGQIDKAFARFTPEYFAGYTKDYLARAQDPIDYQAREAQKQLAFQLARQGISSSQAGINQQGLLDETRGRSIADATTAAENATDTLRSNVASARGNLQNQVGAAQSIGSPVAGSTIDDVNASLQTQRNAISGVTSTAGDVATSLQAVPTVNTLSNIFANVLGSGGQFLGGYNQGSLIKQFNAGLSGTDPNKASTV